MKHRLYEGWIMAGDELTPDQRSDLETHLQECEACSRLAEADRALEKALTLVQMSEPKPGFTQRWRARMDERRITAHRRQTSGVLVFLSFGATALLLPILLNALLVLISPEDVLFDLAGALVDWLSLLKLIGNFVTTSVSTLFSTIPLVWWMLMITILAGLGVLWGFSLQRLGYLPSKERS